MKVVLNELSIEDQKSGWFDGANFEEWFLNVILPWAMKLDRPKCLLGDNLSSHINIKVVKECQK